MFPRSTAANGATDWCREDWEEGDMSGVVIRPSVLWKLALALAVAALLAATQWPPAQHSLRPLAASAAAADPIYMKYGTIKGDVVAQGYEQQIELTSLQWGVGRAIAVSGANADREATVPRVSEITITKPTDSASVSLLKEALGGTGQQVIISFVKTDKGNLTTYLQFTLENTLISGFSISSGGDRPSESLTLNFTKVEFKSFLGPAPESVIYDLAQAKVI
jgi:type VI secretion system secreted protein Hcp